MQRLYAAFNSVSIWLLFCFSLLLNLLVFPPPPSSLSGALIRQGEDDIRIFLQEMSLQRFNADEVIAELQLALGELSKAHLSQPPQVRGRGSMPLPHNHQVVGQGSGGGGVK